MKFEGVSLDKLMQSVGAKGERVAVVALNDYSSEIPMEDFAKYKARSSRSSATASICRCATRDRCSSCIPMTTNPELKSQKFYSRSAWQVAKLIVK